MSDEKHLEADLKDNSFIKNNEEKKETLSEKCSQEDSEKKEIKSKGKKIYS